MQTNLARRLVVMILATFGAVACGQIPLRSAALANVPIAIGETRTVSLGGSVVEKYECPCYEIYQATADIKVKGSNLVIPLNSRWDMRYEDPALGEKYLVNKSFHPALVLVIRPDSQPLINPDRALLQIQGAQKGRALSFEIPAQASAIRFFGYRFFGDQTWRLQYLGQDRSSPDVLRFTIEEVRPSGERVGQVEYLHDMKKGNEFVVRGVRVRVVEVASDGRLTYQIAETPT